MINANDLKALTKANNPFKKLDEMLEPAMMEQAKKGIGKCLFEGLKSLCPTYYSFGEWVEQVSKHYTKLGYHTQMYSDNNRFWIMWEND